MINFFFIGMIPTSDLVSTKDHFVSETEYLANGLTTLTHLRCPICKEYGHMSKGYFYRCGECINYFSKLNLEIENEVF